jgi:colanic acid/amylovoran biosynthesis glycosyltransferase
MTPKKNPRSEEREGRVRVAHYLSEYPAPTQTFITPLLSEAGAFQPEVWALRLGPLSEDPTVGESPTCPVEEIGGSVGGPMGGPSERGAWLGRIRTRMAGFELREELAVWRHIRQARHPVGIVHAHFGPQGFAAARPCARQGVPLVTTFYGYDLGVVRDPVWARRYRILWDNCAAFLVEGPAMGAHLASLGAPRDRIRIQRLPVPADTLPYRPRFMETGGPLKLIQVARLVEKKGVDLSIRAVAELAARGDEVHLTLVGDGPLWEDLRKLARTLGVDQRVSFLGPRPHAETKELLLKAHVLIQPSRTASNGDTEGGAPYTLLEAQATGMCVVASRHADIPNVVAPEAWFGFEENDLGELVEAVARVRRHANEWEERGASARAFVERHHRARELVGELEELYRALVEGRKELPGDGLPPQEGDTQ